MKCLKCGKSSTYPFCPECNAGKLPAYVYALWQLDEVYLVNEEEHLQKQYAESAVKKMAVAAKPDSVMNGDSNNSLSSNTSFGQDIIDGRTNHTATENQNDSSDNTGYSYQYLQNEVKKYKNAKLKEAAISHQTPLKKPDNKNTFFQSMPDSITRNSVVSTSDSKQSNVSKQNKSQIAVYANADSTIEAEKSLRKERRISGDSLKADEAIQHRSSSAEAQKTSKNNVSPEKRQITQNNANNLQNPKTQTDSHKSGLYYHFTGRIQDIKLTINIFGFCLKAFDCVFSYAPFQFGSEAYECEFELKTNDNNTDSKSPAFVFYGDPELIHIADEVSITAIKRGETYYITRIVNLKSNTRIKPKRQISSTLFVFLLVMVYSLLFELFWLIGLAISPSLYLNIFPLMVILSGIAIYLWWIIKYYRDKTVEVPAYKKNSSE